MTREEAYQLLTKYLTNKNLIKHCLSCEAGMKGVYKHLHKDDYDAATEEKWGITGLLHDIDYEIAQKEDKLDQHGTLIFTYEPDTIPEDIAHGIKAHAYEYTHVMPESDMDWGIAAVDQLTGLIIAGTLVLPDKKMASLTVESILKRFKEKSFAKGANREAIMLCEEHLGIPLPEFVGIVLIEMQGIHEELGL